MISSTLCSFVLICAPVVLGCGVRLGEKEKEIEKGLGFGVGVPTLRKRMGVTLEFWKTCSFCKKTERQHQKQNQPLKEFLWLKT
jgi:hypothetical protein